MRKNIAIITLVCLFASCTDNFQETNKNSIQPTKAAVQTLLPAIIFGPLNSHLNLQTRLTNQIMHYAVWRNDNQLDYYDFVSGNGIFSDYWQEHYKAVRSYRELISLTQGSAGANLKAYTAAGKIMNAFHMASISEVFVDAPYSEAGKGSEVLQPKYDDQEAIYTGILKDLEEANTMLSESGVSFAPGGDILFGGSVEKWRKFANSLRLRYLLRASNKLASAATNINTIVSDPTKYPIITSNSEAAIYNFSGVAPNVSDFANLLPTAVTALTTSERFIDALDGVDNQNNTADDDPRLAFFSSLPNCDSSTDNKCTDKYLGAKNGTSREIAQGTGGNAELYASSHTGRFQTDKSLLDFVFISYSEVRFILAEAAMKGWISSGTPKEHYDAAIAANLEYWKITMPNGFADREDVKWDNSMERLMAQKWVAMLWNNTVEMWGEQKRTGLPNLVTTLGDLAKSNANNKVATRVFYPQLEQSTNGSNYQAASSKFGASSPEKITAKNWYQN